MSNEIEKKADGALGQVINYGEFAGQGTEEITSRDTTTPYLAVLQSGSPQTKEGSAQFIEGATPGMLFNSVSRKLYPALIRDGKPAPAGIYFQPAVYRHEWEEREAPQGENQGKFVGRREFNDAEVAAAIKQWEAANGRKFTKSYVLANGHHVSEAYTLIGFVQTEENATAQANLGQGDLISITFNSTKIKPFRDLMARLWGVYGNPPLFAHRIKINTKLIPRTNDNGQNRDSYNFVLQPAVNNDVTASMIPLKTEDGSAIHPLILAGKALNDAFKAGQIKRAEGDVDHADGAAGTKSDANIPF